MPEDVPVDVPVDAGVAAIEGVEAAEAVVGVGVEAEDAVEGVGMLGTCLTHAVEDFSVVAESKRPDVKACSSSGSLPLMWNEQRILAC